MWLSQRGEYIARNEMAAEIGPVTLGGNPAGAYLSGERRGLPVFSPGGYLWRPAAGQQVLVLKTGADKEAPCVVGVRQSGEPLPGEVCLFNDDKSSMIRLGQNGALKLTGEVFVNGETLEDIITRIVLKILSG